MSDDAPPGGVIVTPEEFHVLLQQVQRAVGELTTDVKVMKTDLTHQLSALVDQQTRILDRLDDHSHRLRDVEMAVSAQATDSEEIAKLNEHRATDIALGRKRFEEIEAKLERMAETIAQTRLIIPMITGGLAVVISVVIQNSLGRN